MKKMYQIPELQITLLKNADIIMTSEDPNDPTPIDPLDNGDFAVFG